MGLFQHEITSISDVPRPRVSRTATFALISASVGVLTAVGLLFAIPLGHIALVRIYLQREAGVEVRGRRLAIAALWVSYSMLVIGVGAFLVMLVAAYAALPSPPSLF